MSIRSWSIALVSICAVTPVASPSVSAQTARDGLVLVVPIDLYNYADSVGCPQVTDFFNDREGVREPPYTYVGNSGLYFRNTGVMWCRPTPGERNHTLLIKSPEGGGPYSDCPSQIPDQDFIGGLSVHRGGSSLSEYRHIDDGTLGPNTRARAPDIKSEWDGVAVYYSCHEGRWLSFVTH